MIYLMNIHTGSVDTEENWLSDYNSMSAEAWGSQDFNDEGSLVQVVKDGDGDWTEI